MQAGEAVAVRNFVAVRWVLIYTMALNLLVTGVKLVVGYLTGSLSLIADGFDSLFDSASNVVGLVGIYVARRPPDPSHPYGHRKFETSRQPASPSFFSSPPSSWCGVPSTGCAIRSLPR